MNYRNITDVNMLYEEGIISRPSLTESSQNEGGNSSKDKQETEGREIEDSEKPKVKPQADNFEVHYARDIKKYTNIFKHIVIFTNDRDPKGNKTLKNIYEAVDNLKKDKCDIIPELHVFVAAEIEADEKETEIKITDGDESFVIKDESNLDTLIFARLGVQGEDQCEHVVQILQDRGFLVLNPVKYSALACDKYDSAVLFQKGEIPQPNFVLMTKEILYDKKQYDRSMKDIYPEWDPDEPDKNEKLSFVVKILDGHGGTGVMMIDGKKILAALQLIFAVDPERRLIIQKKEEGDGGDIRVHVLTLRDKQVILAQMKRVKIGGDFRSNVSLGAKAEPVKLTKEQEQIALKTAQLSHLPWCAVDIMPLVKGSNPEIGDNVVLEINASPGTDGISDVMNENFINILLNELDDPSQFMLQDKTAGFVEAVSIKFSDNPPVEKKFLAKLDTGNSTKAVCLEVGEYNDNDKEITFKIDGKEYTYQKQGKSVVNAGEQQYERPVIILPELTLGLRKVKNVPVSIVKSRENKSTNCLINRDILSKLGYVVHPNKGHILTPEIEKVKIII